MQTVRKIVVGVELPKTRPWDAANITAPSRLAVRHAYRMAAALNVPIHVITVLDEPTAGLFGSKEAAEATAKEESAETAAVLKDLDGQYRSAFGSEVQSTTEVTFGRAWHQLLIAGEFSPQTLTVCGTREQGAIARMLFGSTGLKLLRNAPGPVWLVKPRVDDEDTLDVLAASDLSDMGEEVLQAAVSVAAAVDSRLTVMHVIDEDLDRHMERAGASAEELRKYRAESRELAEAKLNEQLSVTDYRTLQNGVKTEVAEGTVDNVILSAVRDLDIDLLIIATSGRGGIPGMVFGNTAERLLNEVTCSVLAIKPEDFVCPVKS